jgi:N-acetylglucosaminylphosphatidylinositol deacetylase
MHLLRHYTHTTTPPRLFTLITVPVATKYTGIVAPILAKFDLHKIRIFYHIELLVVQLFRRLGLSFPVAPQNRSPNQGIMPVFISGISGYAVAIRAMREHASQLVWFRYLYVAFSRYMWVNEWVEVRVSSST